MFYLLTMKSDVGLVSLTTNPPFHHQEQQKKKLSFSKMNHTLKVRSTPTMATMSGTLYPKTSLTPNPDQHRLGKGVFLNFDSTFVDTCPITIGARTLVGPHCSFYSGTHPLDPFLRNGIKGPELGKPITIGEDCWFGGNVIVLPGVTIGRGVTIGAGSVVTKDVPPFHVVAGNPARVLRKIEPKARDPTLSDGEDGEVVVVTAAKSI
jgi:acetyltransferase-like isoleucine patch superfamily enzyme